MLGAIHFFLDALGNNRKRDQLRMRVFQRGAGCISVILENQDVTKAVVFLQIVDAIAETPRELPR